MLSRVVSFIKQCRQAICTALLIFSVNTIGVLTSVPSHLSIVIRLYNGRNHYLLPFSHLMNNSHIFKIGISLTSNDLKSQVVK